MQSPYHVLPSYKLRSLTSFYRHYQGVPETVRLSSPALDGMTDLRRVKAVTIAPTASVNTALQKMIYAEVRLLLVTNADDVVLGVITARDIMGEKPVNYAAESRVPRDAVLVEHIMTPAEHIQVLKISDVLRANIGDIILTLKEANRQHALVVETAATPPSIRDVHDAGISWSTEDTNPAPDMHCVRGIFSTSHIGKQLGIEIQSTGRVQNFAELEVLLNEERPPKHTIQRPTLKPSTF